MKIFFLDTIVYTMTYMDLGMNGTVSENPLLVVRGYQMQRHVNDLKCM